MSVNGNQQRGILIAGSAVSTYVGGQVYNSVWTQAIASTTVPILITGVVAAATTTSGFVYSIRVGTGAAASEVLIWSAVASLSGNGTYGSVAYVLPYPIRVPAGTRVALWSDTAVAFNLYITYVNESSVV